MNIITLWCDNITIAWWKMFLIGIFFIVMNLIIFLAMWYMRRDALCECGYPKRNKKSMKKKLKSYTVLDNLLLVRLVSEAERRCPLLYISLVCHCISVLAMGVSLVGFVGCMLTLADGWALTLLVVPELACLGFTVLIEFIPDLIWLPSERKRYRFK